jgi:uncharacterized oligopeptide transporter (OPT) family protein
MEVERWASSYSAGSVGPTGSASLGTGKNSDQPLHSYSMHWVVAWSATLDWGIVGHSLTWCLVARLMLLGALLILVAKLLWLLRMLLVRVPLGVLAFVPLVGWPLVPL